MKRLFGGMRLSQSMSTIDLHIHTSYSDGKYSPEELLSHAVKIGLQTIAFTDHDNANGFRHALPLAQRYGIELIPAIEFTCRWPLYDMDDDIDLLGYFIDVDEPDFQAFEDLVMQDAFARIEARCAHLTEIGYPLSLEDVLCENPNYASGLYTILAIQRKGHADSWGEAIRILHTSRPHAQPCGCSVFQAIEQIHRVGGVTILAHPITMTHKRPERLSADQLASLVEMGLDGLEVYHPRLNEEDRTYFLQLAQHFDLLVSGGSDEHGWSSGLTRMGTQQVTPEILEALRSRHLERKAQT